MTIHEVAEVVVDASGGYKFIVAEVSDGTITRLVVRADQSCELHRYILRGTREQLSPHGLQARCIGGGRILINPEAKTVKIWDKSGDFGFEPDRMETVRMLQSAFPDFVITEEVGDRRI
jgi:phosphohistidine phosphatase